MTSFLFLEWTILLIYLSEQHTLPSCLIICSPLLSNFVRPLDIVSHCLSSVLWLLIVPLINWDVRLRGELAGASDTPATMHSSISAPAWMNGITSAVAMWLNALKEIGFSVAEESFPVAHTKALLHQSTLLPKKVWLTILHYHYLMVLFVCPHSLKVTGANSFTARHVMSVPLNNSFVVELDDSCWKCLCHVTFSFLLTLGHILN